MDTEIKKAPEGTHDVTQYMIKYANKQMKKLKSKEKELLQEISEKIFNHVEPRVFDEMIFLIAFNVAKAKMIADRMDTHKLILSEVDFHFKYNRRVWDGDNS